MGGSILAASTLAARQANAQARASYDVPEGCPDAGAFEEAVARRAPGIATTSTRVAISGSASTGYDGRLELDGLARDVHGATCEETVEALALAVAMAASEDVVETEPAVPSPPRSPVWSRPAPRAPMPVRPAERSHFVAGAGVGAASAVGPGVSPAIAIFGGLEIAGGSLRAGGSAARSAMITTDQGTASFERWALHVDGCPLSVRAGALHAAPCARLDAGVLRGSGESLENAESKALLWLSASAGGRLGLDLGATWFLEGEARVVVPLLRHAFFVRPRDFVHRVPSLAAEAMISMGYRFSK